MGLSRYTCQWVYPGTLLEMVVAATCGPPDEAAQLVVVDHAQIQCEKRNQAAEWDRVVARDDRHQGLEEHPGHRDRRVQEPSVDKGAARKQKVLSSYHHGMNSSRHTCMASSFRNRVGPIDPHLRHSLEKRQYIWYCPHDPIRHVRIASAPSDRTPAEPGFSTDHPCPAPSHGQRLSVHGASGT